MKLIEMRGRKGKGKFAKVDDNLFEYLSGFKWHLDNKQYAVSSAFFNNKRYHIMMHRVVAFTPGDLFTDHINRDKLDNQYQNLRWCNKSQNNWNSKKRAGTSSRYKGVLYVRRTGSWRTLLRYKGVRYRFGEFKTEHMAGLMYDFWATELFGKFANTNFKVVAHG